LCGLEIEVENEKVIAIRGDKNDVFSRGHICPKALALKDLHEDPDRLKRPVKRTAKGWVEISWDDAIQEAAQRMADVQKKYGQDSLGVYQGNPSIHNLGTTLFSPGFVRALKTKNRFSATSVDQLAHHLASEFMFGHMNRLPVPDIDRTDYWLVLGGNPVVSNGSIMTVPDIRGRIRSLKSRGGKLVVVDPRKTETADRADQHIYIRPGTDIYFLLALIHEVFRTGGTNLAHVAPFIDDVEVEAIKTLVTPFSPNRVTEVTGIEEGIIKACAKEFIQAQRAVCYGRLGVSAAHHGGLCQWAVNVLNILTGVSCLQRSWQKKC
jgi:anaerobic selenocysteine-containing dehydrogenase